MSGRSSHRCAYCGHADAFTKDHAISSALYPLSPPEAGKPQVQRITVPACEACNRGWSADEAHFRDTLLLAGEPSPTVRALWETKTRRSFLQRDGRRRVRDLTARIVVTATGSHMIYPARDERVMRVVRKAVRGLCYHHGLRWPVSDGEIWADVQRFDIPPEFFAAMQAHHVDEQVAQYRFSVLDDPDMESCWTLQFFGRTQFLCIVFRSVEARNRLEAGEAD